MSRPTPVPSRCSNDSSPQYWSWSPGQNEPWPRSPVARAQDRNLAMPTFISSAQTPKNAERESMDARLAERATVAQRGMNPFLQTDYAQDIGRFP